MRPSPAYNESERAILIEVYDNPNIAHTSYTLSQKLNPTTKVGTPEYGAAFTKVRETTEDLIVRGVLRGKRLKGANGIYFTELKLTPKGEKAAIQERRRKADFEKELPQIIKNSNAVVEEMRKFDEKK